MIPDLVTIHTSLLTDLGDAVRAKTGGSEEMTLDEMAETIYPTLPSGYEPITCIGFSKAYLDTGVIMANDVDAEYDVVYTQYQTYGHLLCSGHDWTAETTFPRRNSLNSGANFNFVNANSPTPSFSDDVAALNNKFVVKTDLRNDKMIINGIEYSISPSVSAQSFGNYNLYFGSFLNKTGQSMDFVGYAYKLILRKAGTIVRNYIPCKRTLDKVFGFYEAINENFVQPIGTYSGIL